ncbi:M3 family oligoendopeptidase [Helicobacter himalayensis]|uniref:M3 family oligoendopeptidase n=1 Tax=Helicobacter himalayensis TaxID=1591088 RepID=UPI0009EE3FFE|nr:M3 family oligoendopeptidase [Helicobacter himalayensis]
MNTDSKNTPKARTKEIATKTNATINPARKISIPTQNKWNLKALFPSQKRAQSACVKLQNDCKAFNEKFYDKLDSIPPAQFEAIIKQYENLCEQTGRILAYAFLIFAQDTSKGALYADFEERAQKAHNDLLFFELELARFSDSLREEIAKNAPHYTFYLQKLGAHAKHTLTLKEEQILLKTSPIACEGFARLFDEHLAQMRFKFDKKQISEEEILSLLHSSERKTRKSAQKSFTKGLNKSRHLLTYILNVVRKDVALEKELRGYPKSESARHLSNSIPQKSVDKLIEVVNTNFDVVQKYYTHKARLLGIKELKDYDRYAPLEFKKQKNVGNLPYDEALNFVLEAFDEFSPIFGKIAREAIKAGWVDSHPKPNKRGGAFSHGCVPSAHPFVLLNYTNSRRDAFTIAHEFGHMVHQELSKKVGYLNMDTPLTTAETASVFAEMLLFDRLKKTLSKEELLPLYTGKLEDVFSTLFRQIVMTNFERKIHSTQGELSSQEFDRIWLEENEKMFGDSLKLTKNYASWWSYIPHFIHSPFYCYAYSYGQLLVLALFGLYKKAQSKQEREKFIKTYIEFLSLGGSKSPKDLIKKFGLNIEDSEFWALGMNEVYKLFNEFEELL